LAELVNWNLKTIEHGRRMNFNQQLKKLRLAEATVEQVQAFTRYWNSDGNWLYVRARQDKRKLSAPTPAQVCNEWGTFTAWLARQRALEAEEAAKRELREELAQTRTTPMPDVRAMFEAAMRARWQTPAAD
jgi:hypothetical protein